MNNILFILKNTSPTHWWKVYTSIFVVYSYFRLSRKIETEDYPPLLHLLAVLELILKHGFIQGALLLLYRLLLKIQSWNLKSWRFLKDLQKKMNNDSLQMIDLIRPKKKPFKQNKSETILVADNEISNSKKLLENMQY